MSSRGGNPGRVHTHHVGRGKQASMGHEMSRCTVAMDDGEHSNSSSSHVVTSTMILTRPAGGCDRFMERRVFTGKDGMNGLDFLLLHTTLSYIDRF